MSISEIGRSTRPPRTTPSVAQRQSVSGYQLAAEDAGSKPVARDFFKRNTTMRAYLIINKHKEDPIKLLIRSIHQRADDTIVVTTVDGGKHCLDWWKRIEFEYPPDNDDGRHQ